MATPEEFRAAFAMDGVVIFPADAVSSLAIAASDADWLTKVGLPRSAAPYLSFGSKYEINIPTVTELWGVNDGGRYRAIGSNGSGDPIAIDTATAGEVVYLSHDNAFQRVFINSSVTKLAEVLLASEMDLPRAETLALQGGDEARRLGMRPVARHAEDLLGQVRAARRAADPLTARNGRSLRCSRRA